MKKFIFFLLAILLAIFGYHSSSMAEDIVEEINYKLSYSTLHTKSLHANDINLRAGKNDQYIWLAAYQKVRPILIKLEAAMKELIDSSI